jgi:long-chain acyl-CoA synthetase
LTQSEVQYIVENCQAKVFITDSLLLQRGANGLVLTQICIGESFAEAHDTDYLQYAEVLRVSSATRGFKPVMGSLMLYTSGTTGKPKGVYRDTPEPIVPQYAGSFADYDTTSDVALCCGPAYHSAPLLFDLRWPLASGVPIVMMERWDALKSLELIETYRVTHAHMVATMFQRLLAIDAEVRNNKNLSSLRFLVHGAAPCPIPVKRAMIEWLGPVLIEYYGATEGGNGIHVTSEDWLKKPGTVGRMDASLGHVILDEEMNEVPSGVAGRIYFKAPETGRFSYFGDADKTASAYAGDRFTLGDIGYVDEDRFLFLTGRIAECIISGGVNIYPQEVDDVMLNHPAVRDVCTVGIPDSEWGEQVVSLIVLKAGHAADEAMTDQLLAYAAKHLASFKRPRRILFEQDLPRSASGKLLRQQVRQRFWQTQGRTI